MYRFPIEAWKKNYSDYSSQKRLESSERGKKEKTINCAKNTNPDPRREIVKSPKIFSITQIDTSRPFVDFSPREDLRKK